MFSFAHSQKTFIACLRVRRQLNLHLCMLMVVIIVQYITSTRIHRFKRHLSPLFHKIFIQKQITIHDYSWLSATRTSGRRRTWNSIIAPEIACITAPNIAACKGIPISMLVKWDIRGGGGKNTPRCWFDPVVINVKGRFHWHDLTLRKLVLTWIK